MSYNNLIDVNIAPLNATKIGVYNSNGEKIGKIELGNLKKTSLGNKLYSFGVISDIHLQDNTAQTDFQTALTYFNNNESVAFTCICGDLTSNGTTANLQDFKNYVQSYSPNTQVYATSGNHECWGDLDLGSVLQTYTGHPVYYSFTQGNDVFIFVGLYDDVNGNLFTKAELQWLYETLETNRNKRCFVFEHVRPQDTCGNAYGIYNYDIWGGTEQTVFESLMSHYKNVILFHGHSHLRFGLQTKDNKANYEHDLFGIHSVHIPSLAVPRDGDATGANSRKELYAESEGYVVDVYENAIVLRGRDFVDAKFLPIAIYCLDTTLKNITANTYTDSTGTIDTSSSNSKPCTSISLNSASLSFTTNNTQTLMATVSPTDTTDTIEWSSNNTDIATVSNGVVTPVANGTCTITVTCGSQSATCNVTVSLPTAQSITWSKGTKLSSSNGSESADAQYSASDYIEVDTSKTYTLATTYSGFNESSASCKICYYDSSKKFLSCSSNAIINAYDGSSIGKSNVIPLVSNTKYIRLRAYAYDSGAFDDFLPTITITH